jgi:essential nuclear protein 1
MDKFMHADPSSLSTTIADKIAAAERLITSKSPASTALNEKVVLVYNKVGLLLSRYKSGKLPKTFKIIPSLPNWFEILMLTDPENWTPHATYEATRLFTSNLRTNDVVKFFSLVLLERVRADIYENKYGNSFSNTV